MIDFDRLNKENTLVALTVQACIGAISANMRMISFSYSGNRIDLFVDLRHASDDDAEEAKDMADELANFSETFRVIEHVRIVGEAHIPIPSDGRIVIYKQREPVTG
jgi:hypothetical protein